MLLSIQPFNFKKMRNKIAQYIYIYTGNGRFPEEIYYSMKSFKKFHPDWKIKLWVNAEFVTEFQNNPLFLKITEELSASIQLRDLLHKTIYGATSSVIFMTDIARYVILYEEGGFYIDNDSIFIREIPELAEESRTFLCHYTKLTNGVKMLNTFIYSDAGNPFFLDMLDNFKSFRSVDKKAYSSITYLEQSSYLGGELLEYHNLVSQCTTNLCVPTLKDYTYNPTTAPIVHVSTSSVLSNQIYLKLLAKLDNPSIGRTPRESVLIAALT